MAWTNWGFDGTINEAQWAQMAGLLGNGYVAAGNGDCVVTAVGGARSVSVAAGTLYGDGVVSVNSGAETVAMTTPVNGQWYVIALRRTWATNTAALVAIAGATTTTTTPTAPPTSFPTLNTNVGVLTDQPIAWAWCNSANTTVVVYDIRLKAVKSLPPVVANGTERDAKFMSPTQGLQVWRDDLGAVETYYGLYNSSTNPGGRDSAGWYVNDRQTGLVPIRPTSATIVSGTGSSNSIGTISFTTATAVDLRGIFSSNYKKYKVIIEATKTAATGGADIYARVSSNGTVISTDYSSGYTLWGLGTTTGITSSNNTMFILSPEYYADRNVVEITVVNPFEATPTQVLGIARGVNSSLHAVGTTGGYQNISSSYDGLYVAISASSFTGTIQVFGIVDK